MKHFLNALLLLTLYCSHLQADCIKTQQTIEPNKLTAVLGRCHKEKPETLALDMEAIIQFCGDIEGCRIELGAAGLHDTVALRKFPLMGPSCRFFYNAKSGEWSVSPYCYYRYITSLYPGKNDVTDISELAIYRPYASSRSGMVTDNRVSTALAFTKACYLTDVAPDENKLSGNAHYKLTDVGKSWFLHTTTQAWAAKAISQEKCGPDESKCKYKQIRWVGDQKYCVLIIED